MKIKSQKDFFSGLMFMTIGVAFAWGSTTYNIGEGARMGPGYFPLLLGIVLTLLGGGILFESLVVETPDGEKIGKWAWRPLAFILLANFAFGVLLGGVPALHIPAMGLIVAIIALTFISAFAGDEFNWKEIAVLSGILAVGSYLAFVWLLKLQFPVWPSFIAG
ncbi:tripartite tricarboxylate transporter TctB family protein [Ramlibacter albus]|uniref:Tripartite tricarboxylate transporter TctB family protein n=1 Tax=Ramlibacter albus TaxID=2079448 RepID=A0A923M8J1_9BURK|nr:tripartite tricarboxylate transporter TctB family protein [Ramlibacter albus]MBC5766257.1 tripartite tricarboxylate transporter TctB family protein [Ramlibacter albus]